RRVLFRSSFEQNPTPARQPSPAPPRGKRRVPHLPEELLEEIRSRVGALEAELIDFRRDMHANPELTRNERRATAKVADRLRAAGLHVHLLPETGLWVDVPASDHFTGQPIPLGSSDDSRPRIVLRADLVALPVLETSGVEFASTNGVAHACGHDIHTTVVLGAGLVLA